MPEQIPEQESSSIMNELISRIRILERNQQSSREKLLTINQNMVEEYKNMIGEIKGVNSEIKETEKEILKIHETLKKIIDEMGTFARKENLKVLEKYINIWDPMKFVTEEEVLDLIKKRGRNVKKRRIN